MRQQTVVYPGQLRASAMIGAAARTMIRTVAGAAVVQAVPARVPQPASTYLNRQYVP